MHSPPPVGRCLYQEWHQTNKDPEIWTVTADSCRPHWGQRPPAKTECWTACACVCVCVCAREWCVCVCVEAWRVINIKWQMGPIDNVTFVSTEKATDGLSLIAISAAVPYMLMNSSGDRFGWNRGTRISEWPCWESSWLRTLLVCWESRWINSWGGGRNDSEGD